MPGFTMPTLGRTRNFSGDVVLILKLAHKAAIIPGFILVHERHVGSVGYGDAVHGIVFALNLRER